MLLPTTFKGELLRYPVRNSASRELIARWLNDDRAESLWKSVQGASAGAAPLQPAELIKAVLDARRSAQASVNRVYGADIGRGHRWPRFNKASADALRDIRETLKLMPDAMPSALLKAADYLEEAAGYLRSLDASRPDRHSNHLGLSDGPKFDLSRKDQGGSRVRKLFMQIVGALLSTRCGRPMDEVVSILVQIAFPGKEVDRDDVTKARISRTESKR
jgi:hypothetical protein